MKIRLVLLVLVVGLMTCICIVEAKNADPYKVLGVDRKASQREIQKAFRKLSLQFHPDKNKNKGAQDKFAEISNAYDILSDEQKRNNYDLYGDENGNPGFNTGGPGAHSGYTHFTGGGARQNGFNFRPEDWQNMAGGQGGSTNSFSFSSGKQRSFDFGDTFSSYFGGGMGGGSQFGGFSRSGKSQSGNSRFDKSIPSVNSQLYRREIVDKGMSWLLFVSTSDNVKYRYYERVIDEVVSSLQGALKVGSVICEHDASLCKELGANSWKAPQLFVYSYASGEHGSLVEYDGDWEVRPLKSFCENHLPRLSKRVNVDYLNVASEAGILPKVLLLTTKKNTPVIWRVLSGLYRKRFLFYDAEVRDVSDPSLRNLGIQSLPAIIGWLPNGEKYVIQSGISVEDLKSGIKQLSGLLDNFEKKYKKTATVKTDHHNEYRDNNIPLLDASNFDDICGDKIPVCMIGAFRSSKSRDRLHAILQSVSRKSFTRRQNVASGSKDSVSYALLDASVHQSFLDALDKSGFKSSGTLLVAYKPKRGTYAAFQGELTEDLAEGFIGSVLNGDVHFSKTVQKPTPSVTSQIHEKPLWNWVTLLVERFLSMILNMQLNR